MRPWSSWARWRGSASTGCWPSTAPPGRPGGPTPRSTIEGDPDAELAVRFALFHLLASAAADGEAAVGARGLTGPVYAGHVFWDADVFVLPVLAAVHPPAARAMLEYRIRRLAPARRLAAARGLAGARFAWESAADGTEATPQWATDRQGRRVRIRTGELEDHIVADVAWAACRYVDWTGDTALLDGPGAGPAAGEGPLLGVQGPLGRGRPGPHRQGHRPRRVPRARWTTTPSPT